MEIAELFALAMMPIGVACVVVAAQWVWGQTRFARPRRDARSAEPIFIPAARIATDLVPLINDLARPGSRLRILGADGLYFMRENGEFLKDSIRAWVKKGMTVEYILLDPGDGVKQRIMPLIDELSDAGGSLNVFALNHDADEISGIVKEMDTRHPTLFFGEDGGNAMWIEGLHRKNSTFAYNVRYISPRAMSEAQQREFDRHREQMDLVVAHCNAWHKDRRLAAA